MTGGYVVMRLALVGQWLRAAASHPAGRRCALRYAAGIAVVQVAWVARLSFPDALFLPAFLAFAAAELAVPVWAESAGRTPWHPRHIAERYGLFTIIVLGESVLASTIGVQVALDGDAAFGDVAGVVVGGLLIVFALWWLYFDMPTEHVVERARSAFADQLGAAFAWGYGHYVVFAAVAAVGAGLAVGVDQATGQSDLTDLEAGLAVAVPVTVYVLAVWALHYRHKRPGWPRTYAVPVTAIVVLGSSASPDPILVVGIILAVLVGLSVVVNTRSEGAFASGHQLRATR
jgi:low temperature requirement protein LtrA